MVPIYDIDWYIDFKNLVFPSPLAIALVNDVAAPGDAPIDEEIMDVVVDASIVATHAMD